MVVVPLLPWLFLTLLPREPSAVRVSTAGLDFKVISRIAMRAQQSLYKAKGLSQGGRIHEEWTALRTSLSQSLEAATETQHLAREVYQSWVSLPEDAQPLIQNQHCEHMSNVLSLGLAVAGTARTALRLAERQADFAAAFHMELRELDDLMRQAAEGKDRYADCGEALRVHGMDGVELFCADLVASVSHLASAVIDFEIDTALAKSTSLPHLQAGTASSSRTMDIHQAAIGAVSSTTASVSNISTLATTTILASLQDTGRGFNTTTDVIASKPAEVLLTSTTTGAVYHEFWTRHHSDTLLASTTVSMLSGGTTEGMFSTSTRPFIPDTSEQLQHEMHYDEVSGTGFEIELPAKRHGHDDDDDDDDDDEDEEEDEDDHDYDEIPVDPSPIPKTNASVATEIINSSKCAHGQRRWFLLARGIDNSTMNCWYSFGRRLCECRSVKDCYVDKHQRPKPLDSKRCFRIVVD
jgi:hypothetical protein